MSKGLKLRERNRRYLVAKRKAEKLAAEGYSLFNEALKVLSVELVELENDKFDILRHKQRNRESGLHDDH